MVVMGRVCHRKLFHGKELTLKGNPTQKGILFLTEIIFKGIYNRKEIWRKRLCI